MELNIYNIIPGRNPRQYFDPAEMTDLENSIRASGVLQPILVRPKGEQYEIVAGERRWRAAKAVYGETGTIPANIREMTDDEADIAALVENTLRADMAVTEESAAAHALVLKFKGDRAEAAAQLGWPMSKLHRRLALMEATPAVREALNTRKISLGHAELLAAAPKDKQDKVLEKVIAGAIPVAALREQLAAISHDLSAAIFDKSECGGCPHNSSVQVELFTQSIAAGSCTNPVCYAKKTDTRLAEIVVEQQEAFPRVELVRPGAVLETIPVVAEGRVGVGTEQAESCKGCGDYGCTVSALPGSEGKIETDLCFNVACHLEKVSMQVRALAPEQTASKETDGKAKAKPPAQVNQAAAPQRLKDYRLSVWKRALQAEMRKSVEVAGRALLAIVLSGNAHHIARRKLDLEIKGDAVGDLYSATQGRSDEDIFRMLARIPLAAVDGLSETDVCRLLQAMDCDLAEHWIMDDAFLDLLTKSEIEAMANEVGLKAALGEGFKKAMTGKKAEIAAALLKVEGFEYRGAVPACMQYAEAKKAKPIKQLKCEQTQEPCCV